MAVTPSPRKGDRLLSRPQPIATFDKWSTAPVDLERWHEHCDRLDEQARRVPPQEHARAVASATRAAALLAAVPDGLAIEDHGLTVAVARQLPGWAAQLGERYPGLRGLFESQLGAYRLLRLTAFAGESLDQPSIKRLHELMCRNQVTYLVVDSGVKTRQPLPKGRYKRYPNHVPRDAPERAYVNVDEVADAMADFVAELATEAFRVAHPVLQAAYALHGLTAIHPFADGNGRVGRALASIAFYRASSLPFFLERASRVEYLAALRSADDGAVQPLVDLVTARGCAAMSFVLESARCLGHAAARP